MTTPQPPTLPRKDFRKLKKVVKSHHNIIAGHIKSRKGIGRHRYR